LYDRDQLESAYWSNEDWDYDYDYDYDYSDSEYYRVNFYPFPADKDLSKYDRTFPMHDIRGKKIDTEGGVSTFYMDIYYDQYDWSNSKYCYMEAVLNEDNKPVNGFDVKEDPYGYDGPMEDSTCNKVG
jgi:hypothetical protein